MSLTEGIAKGTAAMSRWALRDIFHRDAANFPGKIGLYIDHNLVGHAAAHLECGSLCVVGTNGKTTTTNLIASALEKNGFTVCCNKTGANLDSGVASALLEHGHAQWAVLECDELWLAHVLPQLKSKYVLLLNLFRDQLDRAGEIELVQQSIISALEKSPETTLIYNADDPLCTAIAQALPNKNIAFGVGESMNLEQNSVADAQVCQNCSSPLEYEYLQYGQLGKYRCPTCGFARPHLDWAAQKVNLGEGGAHFVLENTEGQAQLELSSTLPGSYMVYNLSAVGVAATLLGCSNEAIQEAVSEFSPQNGRLERLQIDQHPTLLNLAKNPTGMNQNLRIALADKRPFALAIFINDKEADGHDISWLWDVDFEELAARPDIKVFAGGIRKNDLQVRLKYAGVHAQLVENAREFVAAANDSLYTSATAAAKETANEVGIAKGKAKEKSSVSEEATTSNNGASAAANNSLYISATAAAKEMAAHNKVISEEAATNNNSAGTAANDSLYISATAAAKEMANEVGIAKGKAEEKSSVSEEATTNNNSADAAANDLLNSCPLYAIANYTALPAVKAQLEALANESTIEDGKSDSAESNSNKSGSSANPQDNTAPATAQGSDTAAQHSRTAPATAQRSNTAPAQLAAQHSRTAPATAQRSNTTPARPAPQGSDTAAQNSRTAPATAQHSRIAPQHSSAPAQQVQPVVIAHVFPKLLNLYGDGGNVTILRKRLEWRGIPVEVRALDETTPFNLQDVDLVFLGGAPDREQEIASRIIMQHTREFATYINEGGPCLAICGGYQMLGRNWLLNGESVPGLGIGAFETRRAGDAHNRLVGNISLRVPGIKHPVVGYENHAGRTYLDNESQALGQVVSKSGRGNNDTSHADGYTYKNLIGTYLHGPVLAKNPELADTLLQRAMNRWAQRVGYPIVELTPLNDTAELKANAFMAGK